MNAVEEMFKKTSHSAKVFAMWLDPEALPGTEEAFPWFSLVHTKEREGAPRKPDKNGTPRKPYVRREAWAVPGGTVEASDYENIPDDADSNYAYRKASQRESRREGGLEIPLELFLEKWSIHVPPIESDHIGSDYLETHYYLVVLKTKEQDVPIVELDEVIEMEWWRLDKIPLPKNKKWYIGTFSSHIKNLHVFLQKLQTRYEDADIWLKAFKSRFSSYLY